MILKRRLPNMPPLIHEQSPGNVLAEIHVEKGEGAPALETSNVVVRGRFEVPRQEHAYLETEAGWAFVDKDGRKVIIASTQSPHRDRLEIAKALGLNPDHVRVVAPYLGGAFGGKDGINVQVYLALALFHSQGRPVKMWWDREESFLASVKRMPAWLDYRLGADNDGNLWALDCRIIMDAGAYEHLAGEILALCVEHAGGPYRIPHVHIHGRSVYTNNPPGGPFRGFGVPQAASGIEQMMDILADRLNMDRIDVRRKNVVYRGDQNPVGVTLTTSTGAGECLSRVNEHHLWKQS